MELHYSNKTQEIINIEDRLIRLSLAYKVLLSEDIIEPSMVDGSNVYLGYDKMNIYLDQLDREKEQWYYCDC